MSDINSNFTQKDGEALKLYFDARLKPLETQLTEIDSDVKKLLESKAILEGKAGQIEKMGSKNAVNIALLLSTLALLASIVGLFVRAWS